MKEYDSMQEFLTDIRLEISNIKIELLNEVKTLREIKNSIKEINKEKEELKNKQLFNAKRWHNIASICEKLIEEKFKEKAFNHVEIFREIDSNDLFLYKIKLSDVSSVVDSLLEENIIRKVGTYKFKLREEIINE